LRDIQRQLTTPGLASHERSLRQRARAYLIGESARLEDSAARLLRGTGTIHPDLPGLLDPALIAIRAELSPLLALREEES
jgi:hypothetical protein